MNKFGLSIILSLSLALSPLCALDSKRAVQSSSLSSADADFLFASNASHLNVVALSDEEMNLTQGEAIDPLTITAGALLAGAGYEVGREVGKKVVKTVKKWFRW